MKRSKAIVFPHNPGLPIYAIDYVTNQSGIIKLSKAKDIVLAAVLNGDVIAPPEEYHSGEFPVSGTIINIIDRIEFDNAKAQFARLQQQGGEG